MTSATGVCLPVYLAVDCSAAARDHLPQLTVALASAFGGRAGWGDRESLRVAVLRVFPDRTETDDLRPPPLVPLTPSVASGTGFGLAVLARTLRARIEHDLHQLRAEGVRAYRPLLIVVAASAPVGPWQREWQQLTAYDPDNGGGFKAYPVVVPIALTAEAVGTVLPLAHPAGSTNAYTAHHAADHQVGAGAGAGEYIRAMLDSTSAAAAAGTPRHVFPDPIVAECGVRVVTEVLGVPEVTEVPEVSERPATDQKRARVESRYVPMLCSRNGDTVMSRFDHVGGTWLIAESIRLTAALDESAEHVTVNGPFGVDAEYAGCTRCRNRSFVQCVCSQLGCWDGVTTWFTCARCRQSGPVSGSITSMSAAD